jgi:predicted RNA-binding Zn ribbon-like protein
MTDVSQTPRGLDLVIDFVNTLDREERTDALATRSDLSAWLASRKLTKGPGPRATEDDRLQAIELREALRALMLANNGGPPGDRASTALERVARRGGLSVHFASGSMRITADGEGVSGALAQLLVGVVDAISDGTWQRVKACPAADCEWAFYDRSRNHSGVWCDMAVCGNRTKVRAYREREPRGRR